VTNSGLTTARIDTYYQCDLPSDSRAEIVLNYTGGGSAAPSKGAEKKDPALTLHSLGKGRVVFFSTSAGSEDDRWSQFGAKPAYVTLMHNLVGGTVSVGDTWLNLQVGQSLQVPSAMRLTAAPTLVDPTKKPVDIEPVTNAEGETGYHSKPLTRPGLYTLKTGNKSFPVAVNISADAADVRTLKEPQIKKALGDIDVAMLPDTLPYDVLSRNDSNDIGWTLLFILLFLAGVECFLAMHFGHHRRNAKLPVPEAARPGGAGTAPTPSTTGAAAQAA
jgi:hypothetical protein